MLRGGTQIATVSSPGYTDASVTPGSTYAYTVRARDAAGNVSPASNTATVTLAAGANTRTFAAEADARVDEAAPAVNSGTATTLRVNGGSQPDEESYLRFTVSSIPAAVESAVLRIWVTNATVDGPAVWAAGDEWTETAITWSNRPARTGAPVADKGAAPAGAWLEFDVTPLVTGNGTRTFALATTSTDGMDFRSRENTTTAQRPQLVVGWK